MSKNKRYQMSIIVFVFFSISGGGFILKGVISQFTEWGNNSFLLYLIATLVYAVPYILMMFEFMSIKTIANNESGYQTWLNAIIGKKYGFFGAFFYFFVNLFYFVDLIPNVISYFMFTILNQDQAKSILDSTWFKPIIGLVGILIFWLATWVSAKGPKWMSKIASFSGFAGFTLTIVFMIGAFVAVIIGPKAIDNQTANLAIIQEFDISWAQIGSISWALQSLGGLEALAAYKNNIKGGIKGFRKGIWLNLVIFTALTLTSVILTQAVLPTDVAAESGLLQSIYLVFEAIYFPDWWTNVIAAFLLITTLGGSLMIWTMAPVKILIADAPKGIFGKKLGKVTAEKTPVNGLIAQGIIVTVLLILNTVAQLNSGMNVLLIAIKNLNGGAATIPVLFILFAYFKMRLQWKDKRYDRTFYFCGKKPFWALLFVSPMLIIFVIATLTSLIPDPATFNDNLLANILQVVMGPLGIVAAWIYCEVIWRKWRLKNPDDNSLFNADDLEDKTNELSEQQVKQTIKTPKTKKQKRGAHETLRFNE